jgi:hypothetical protein
MTVKGFNTNVCPKLANARAFLHALDNALEKGESEEAKRQVQIAGWGEEVRATLLDAIDALYLAQKQLID